jgi:hypothetical protein
MKSFLSVALLLVSLPCLANTLACLQKIEDMFGGDNLLTIRETRSSDGKPLQLELSDLTIRESSLTTTVNSQGRKDGSNSGMIIDQTTGNFDIRNCRVSSIGLVSFKMGSVSISQINSNTLRASVSFWSSEFVVIR